MMSTQTASQLALSVSKGCPFVSSQIGIVEASPEVQEDVKEGRWDVVMLQWTYTTPWVTEIEL